jgi:hypothetical protein
MNVTLHPAIAGLDPESLCYSIYNQLYHNFFNAQDKKDEAHPWGIVEGDETSIRLRNTAYGFAEAIAGAAPGGIPGEAGVSLLDYLKKTGGNMTGYLMANYGFQAGVGNTRILETCRNEKKNEAGQTVSEIFGIRITGNLEVGGSSLFVGGKQILSYAPQADTAFILSGKIDFGDSALKSAGEFIIGEDKETGICLSPHILMVKGQEVFHRGNANLETVDWRMKNGFIDKNLNVAGTSLFSGMLRACQGLELGCNGNVYLSLDTDNIRAGRFLSFASGYGIKIDNAPVLVRVNEKDVQLGAIGGDLHMGSTATHKIRLQANVSDTDGGYVLLSMHGAAYFPDSLTVRHNFGEILLSSYRKDSSEEGIIIHKKLRFASLAGAYFDGKDGGIAFSSFIEHVTPEQRQVFSYETLLKYLPSSSRYKPLDRFSASLGMTTEADFFLFEKPMEAKRHIGIDGSFTRLTDGCLFFTGEQYLLSAADGIKHASNAYFLENLSSERFSSGFAGSGWAIVHNRTSGNVVATFDELTVRKKMRIYELEVQKTSATNGSLWISDTCQGDTVVKIEN